MNNTILKIENISKQYRLGLVGTGTLSHDLNRWWHKIRGKDDPYLKIGALNDRTTSSDSEYVWALKDINFDVAKGDIVGIIGKNGAGKSTLLKILSRVTGPTTGSIKSKGRIASLLEVGTGFHPELTGRENIYINGAILGMSKAEITSKIDEIVAFSGCERYIDTPTKRYSSGMTVRLAFAVAAHLEPDILIVDEVLSVGDAEFQKKAIGKMQDISNSDGRTVLFVSHNMAAVKSLCTRGIVLQNGKSVFDGTSTEAVDFYLNSSVGEETSSVKKINDFQNKKPFFITEVSIITSDKKGRTYVYTNEDFWIKIKYKFNEIIRKCHMTLVFKDQTGEVVLFLDRSDYYKEYYVAKKGCFESTIKIPNPLLKPGKYYISIGLANQDTNKNAHELDILSFTIKDVDSLRDSREGAIFLPVPWEITEI